MPGVQEMIKLDRYDIDILTEMYGYAPTFEEIESAIRNEHYRNAWNRPGTDDIRRRLYRMSKHGLCACDTPGMHPGQPLCWSTSPEGERVITEVEKIAWGEPGYVYRDEPGYVYEYIKQKERFDK